MKKIVSKILIFALTLALICTAVGCSTVDDDSNNQLPKLSSPQVTIDSAGVASWSNVDHAIYYMYVIDEGEEKITDECTVTLSHNQSVKVKAISGSDKYSDSDFSQYKTYIKSNVETTKLSTPQVSVNSSGVASWGRVTNAQYYYYVINNGQEVKTTALSVTLNDKQSIKVKAGSDDEKYTDSDFSQSVTYNKGVVTTKLSTPQVSVNNSGVASWGRVTNAQYYFYVINDGQEVKTTALSVTLNDKQTIKVKAGSDDEKYTDSDFSQSVTYNKPDPDHKHTDANSDGVCDGCGKSVLAQLSFLAVNDLHGKVIKTDTQPGLDKFTTYIKNLYADTAREEVLLSSGDMWQGTVESSSNKGGLMTEWMNDVGFVSMTLGNHEYDWGPDTIKPNSELADFPFLGINITYNNRPVDYCQPSVIVEKGGVKIGIIGAIGDCWSSISGDFQTGLKFATGSALTSLVKTEADRLRNQEGCDFIVYSIHDGVDSKKVSGLSVSGVTDVTNSQLAYYDTSLSDGYIDLVFESHSHQGYMLKDEYGVYHLQGGSENRYISQADVSYNTVTKKYTVTPKIVGKSVYSSSGLKDDPVIDTLYNKYFPDYDPYKTVLGNLSSYKSSNVICDQVAKLYYDKGRELWGGQYDIVLGGGYLKTRNPYDLESGSVTYADIFSILPFDNDIVLGKIKGSDLKSKFLAKPDNYHIYSSISESNVNDSSYYYIIVDSYTSTYSKNNITEVKRWEQKKYARDLLAEFLQTGSWN